MYHYTVQNEKKNVLVWNKQDITEMNHPITNC